jgi:hypothetical protein
MSWQDVTWPSLCSGVKESGTKRAHNFLFPKTSFRIRRTTVLGMFKDSAIILDVNRRSFLAKSATAASVYLSSSRFWTANSLVIFYQLPSVSKSRIPPKHVWSVQSLIPISLLNQHYCFYRRQTGFETKFYATPCSFPPSMTYKENWFYKTSYNSYAVEDKGNSCERMLVDST